MRSDPDTSFLSSGTSEKGYKGKVQAWEVCLVLIPELILQSSQAVRETLKNADKQHRNRDNVYRHVWVGGWGVEGASSHMATRDCHHVLGRLTVRSDLIKAARAFCCTEGPS